MELKKNDIYHDQLFNLLT